MGIAARSRTVPREAAPGLARVKAAPRAKIVETPVAANGHRAGGLAVETIERAALSPHLLQRRGASSSGWPELAARLDLNASTVYRYVATLEDAGSSSATSGAATGSASA